MLWPAKKKYADSTMMSGKIIRVATSSTSDRFRGSRSSLPRSQVVSPAAGLVAIARHRTDVGLAGVGDARRGAETPVPEHH